MQALSSIKRDLTLTLCISGLVIVCALAWGHPFFGPANNPAATATIPAHHSYPQPVTLTGTVQHNGQQFFLRAASGQIYRLDDPRNAQPYDGRPVKITGNLDTEAQLIHVEHIAPATA
jgi:Protein of unknown function (DUF5818)